MTDTLFKKVDYNLGGLLNAIELGVLGLPDIQRPFVWKNAKVRDLFDSMYRGYPVGYLLLWQTGQHGEKTIGDDGKQKSPSLVIVDGQQRLTSLYAVVRGVQVLRKNRSHERIRIAFNPLEQQFQVTDAAIERDRSYIPNISRVWIDGLFETTSRYLSKLSETREVSAVDERRVQEAISRIHNLVGFPFTALELAPDISEEAVADVFVRINSKGTPLNQADFILTLMSVFWDDGRAELEAFCSEARKPTKGTASAFNYFIDPEPAQLLRVGVGCAFKRARLSHVYSILRGKDLDTGEFSTKRRLAQFKLLKEAQGRTLNLQSWHDFFHSIRLAGFRSGKMISSANNLLFSYILYLIGLTEYKIPRKELREVIAQWFFMSAVTGRFTGSPESAMEFDLARIRDTSEPWEFLSKIRHACDITLTSDFWDVTLPNALATSSPRSPSLFAFNAALVLLDSPALFSKTKMVELLDPAVKGHRPPIERHHLYPKGHLQELGITGTRNTNQIANYAFLEWTDNLEVSDQAPIEYVRELRKGFTVDELAKMYDRHALPDDWEQMEYWGFLERRRVLMAQVIRRGYEQLSGVVDPEPPEVTVDVDTMIRAGESTAVEFKSTLRTNLHTRQRDGRMERAVLKTLAGFLNTSGGTLIVGVADDGTPVGIAADGFANEDKMALHLVNLVSSEMGAPAMTAIHQHFADHDRGRVLVLRCERSLAPVFVKDGNAERFFVRTGPATQELTGTTMQSYIDQRFKN